MKGRTFQVKRRGEFDVVIVGGGTTGVAAALASARSGARTALVEYHGFLGGNAMTGLPWLGFHDREKRRIIGGIAMELVQDLWKLDGATKFYFDPITNDCIGINTAILELVIMRKMREAGVTLHLNSLFVGVEDTEPMRKRILFMDREGLQELFCKVGVDCTDSGDLATKAGARSIFGRERDGLAQVASYTCCFSNIDYARLYDYFRSNPEEIRPFPLDQQQLQGLLRQMESAEIYVLGAFRRLVRKAKSEGLELSRECIPSVVVRKFNYMVSVGTRLLQADPNDPVKFTEATLEGARQAEILLEFYRKYVPGCEEIQLTRTPHTLGLRETRHIIGEYVLTANDLMSARAFPDAIALGGYHMDIHSPDHGGLETRQPPTYQIPYRALLPKGVEGVLVAGRTISATHEAVSSTRVIPVCMAMGQAAGTAAALAAQDNLPLRDLDIEKLRNTLRANGQIIEIPG